MNKVLDFIGRNALKIAITFLVMVMLYGASLYVYSIKRDIYFLTQNTSIDLSGIMKRIQYIIDQNRSNDEQIEIYKEQNKKPSYEELKSHNVYVVGCSGSEVVNGEKETEEGTCWSGTGVVIKINSQETYILTNNHVSGKDKEDVHLYIKNDRELIEADIIDQHSTVDIAVLKVDIQLIDKVAIPGIASTHIQDSVYVVGNPLGVQNVYSEGVVAGFKGVDLLIQLPSIYGSSGSGVYNRDGYLVGLVYALEQYPGFMGIPEARITHSLVVDSVSIKSFLKDLGLYKE